MPLTQTRRRLTAPALFSAAGLLFLSACGGAPTVSQIQQNAVAKATVPAKASLPYKTTGASLKPFLPPMLRTVVSKGTSYVVHLAPVGSSQYLPVAVENASAKVVFLLPVTASLADLSPTRYSDYGWPQRYVALLKKLIANPKYNASVHDIIGLKAATVSRSAIPQAMQNGLAQGTTFTALTFLSTPPNPLTSTTFARLETTMILFDASGTPLETITQNLPG